MSEKDMDYKKAQEEIILIRKPAFTKVSHLADKRSLKAYKTLKMCNLIASGLLA